MASLKSAELLSSKTYTAPETSKAFMQTGVRFEDVMGQNSRVDSNMLADAMADEQEEKKAE